MSLLISLLSGTGGGGSSSGSVTGTILSPVIAASTGALTVTYANGTAGVGATLTNAGAQAAFAIDGISPTVGQRVLIKNQAAPAQNGVYTVTTVGDGTHNWVLTRSTDFNTATQVTVGVIVEVATGTTLGATIWEQNAVVATMGTDSITFVESSGSVTGAALTKTDDTNVTLTLGGTPATALLQATSLTLGWTGNLAVGRGGTGVVTLTTAYGILCAGTTATGAVQTLSSLGNAGQVLISGGASTLPAWGNPSSGITVNQNSSSATLASGNKYICNNGASLITYTLPATAAIGDTYIIKGGSSGGWTVAQNSGQQMHISSGSTTSGATGSLSSSNQYDNLTITCVVANTTFSCDATGSITNV